LDGSGCLIEIRTFFEKIIRSALPRPIVVLIVSLHSEPIFSWVGDSVPDFLRNVIAKRLFDNLFISNTPRSKSSAQIQFDLFETVTGDRFIISDFET
jgi:hypothetical protein